MGLSLEYCLRTRGQHRAWLGEEGGGGGKEGQLGLQTF